MLLTAVCDVFRTECLTCCLTFTSVHVSAGSNDASIECCGNTTGCCQRSLGLSLAHSHCRQEKTAAGPISASIRVRCAHNVPTRHYVSDVRTLLKRPVVTHERHANSGCILACMGICLMGLHCTVDWLHNKALFRA